MANQRTIAASLGLSQATVARALQGSPLVTRATRDRVEEAARRLGYRPNPMVTTLMERIRSGQQVPNRGSIAIVIDSACEKTWHGGGEAYQLQLDGYIRRANLRGYSAECFYLRKPGMSDESIDRILYTRGVSGIILAGPDRLQKASFQFKWERYAVASVSYEWNNLSIDRASSDFRMNTVTAFTELLRRGYQRIGLALPSCAFNPRDSNWLAGYLSSQYRLPRSARLPVFEGDVATGSGKLFRKWYDRWRPDALLCLLGEELAWMHEMGLSTDKDMALVCLNRPSGSAFSGMEENNLLVGELACDIVVNHIIHNERGLAANPRLILVQGKWVDGATLPSQKPAKPTISPTARKHQGRQPDSPRQSLKLRRDRPPSALT